VAPVAWPVGREIIYRKRNTDIQRAREIQRERERKEQ
jgi:hypothetical protein